MNLIKTSIFNSISVAAKIVSMLGINKALALYVGSDGYAMVGQLQNVLQMFISLASGVFGNCATKFTAKLRNDAESELASITRTSSIFSLFFSAILSGTLFLFAQDISNNIFDSPNYTVVFYVAAVFLPFTTMGLFFLAVLNGRREIQTLVIINTISSLLSLVICTLLAFLYGLFGALLALSISQSIVFFISAPLLLRKSWFSIKQFFGKVEFKHSLKILDFAIIAIFSSVMAPLFQIFIRDDLILLYSVNMAGQWEAILRLSNSFVFVLTSIVSIYFLPVFSSLKCEKDFRREVQSGLILIMPFTMVGALIVYFMRDFIIEILFSKEFLEGSVMVGWQLAGDVLRVGSWLISYVMIARAMKFEFVISQLVFHPTFYYLSYYMMSQFGLKGMGIAHFLTYLFYSIFIYFCIYRRSKTIFKLS